MSLKYARSALTLLLSATIVGGAVSPAMAEERPPVSSVESGTGAVNENPQNNESTQEEQNDPGADAQGTLEIEMSAENATTSESAPSAIEDAYHGSGIELSNGGVASDTKNVRIQGSDRFATAVEISKHGFPAPFATGTGTVFVATGLDYPDSLSAAPVAAKMNAPLLLATAENLPTTTANEIQRLKPKTIIVVGGVSAVGSSVATQLAGLLPGVTVKRVQGATRFDTSIELSKLGWPTNGSAANAFIATGYGFADALSAGPAAKQVNGPVLLVPGGSAEAFPATKAELVRLNNTRMYVAGGVSAVAESVVTSLKRTPSHAVTRYAGADRFATSAMIVNQHFPGISSSTYWASGSNFADALTGAAVAGKHGMPLLLSLPDCMPSITYSANDSHKPTNTYLLGGAAALNDTVLWGNECITARAGMNAADISGTQHIYSRINQTRYNLNLQGARFYGQSAQDWSFTMAASDRMRLNPALATEQPWVYEEYVLEDPTSATNANPEFAFSYMESNYPQITRFPAKPAGQRMWVSVGWINRVSGGWPTGWMTVHTGLR